MLTFRRILLWIIRGYQLVLSPWLGSNCRFYPSCSCYTHTAIERYGALRGSWLGLCRLLRCHPFNEGGYDPVPDKSVPDKRMINA
jgi:putative membrane protein insertion efficiency factor